jgi:hypothetical protein
MVITSRMVTNMALQFFNLLHVLLNLNANNIYILLAITMVTYMILESINFLITCTMVITFRMVTHMALNLVYLLRILLHSNVYLHQIILAFTMVTLMSL